MCLNLFLQFIDFSLTFWGELFSGFWNCVCSELIKGTKRIRIHNNKKFGRQKQRDLFKFSPVHVILSKRKPWIVSFNRIFFLRAWYKKNSNDGNNRREKRQMFSIVHKQLKWFHRVYVPHIVCTDFATPVLNERQDVLWTSYFWKKVIQLIGCAVIL